MRRRKSNRQRRGSIMPPAVAALCLAGTLIVCSHIGGEDAAVSVAQKLAENENFIAHAIALELGMPLENAEVFQPRAAATARNEEATDPVSENVYVPPTADATEKAEEAGETPVLSSADKAATVSVNNETSYSVDVDACLSAETDVRSGTEGPRVLIFHTHGSESYTPDEAFPYEPTEAERTTDTNYNVVRVGDELANVLEEKGIETIHIREIFDSPTYTGSYDRSLEAVEEALSEHPDIKIVIDVHRDSILTDDGRAYKTSYTIDGEETAQLMLVVGTDDGGLEHPDWQENLNYAVQLQYKLNRKYPGLMRPVNLRTQRFNQHARHGSMLIEVGSSGNTMTEALAAIKLFGQTLAEDITSE